jgi:hypothetical protein
MRCRGGAPVSPSPSFPAPPAGTGPGCGSTRTIQRSDPTGTADGATAEASREGTSIYGRTREAAGYDFAERSGKLDAQREVGTSGTATRGADRRAAAAVGEFRLC